MRKFYIFLLAAIIIGFAVPAQADRGQDRHEWHERDNHRNRRHPHRDRGGNEGHRRSGYRTRVIVHPRRSVVYAPVVFPSRAARWDYYNQPVQVSITCADGRSVTVRGMGLTLDDLLARANNWYTANSSPMFAASGVTGDYCREYQTTTAIGSFPQASYGTACLMPDGSWHIRN